MSKVSLGLQSPGGFDGEDLVSPAQAAMNGGLLDQQWDGDLDLPVEIRVHGVSGSTGPVILAHPHAVKVGGQRPTAFYRRWSPNGTGRAVVPWPLEGYSWGGLTERPLVSASWVLLAPFMLFNVAHFMLPAVPLDDDGRETSSTARLARALIRLLALAATLQFTGGLVIMFLSTLAWQNVIRLRVGWWWIAWFTDAAPATRLAVGALPVGLVLAVLWRASFRTAAHYEAFAAAGREPAARERPRLGRPGFWRGGASVMRQRNGHMAAGFALVALAVADGARKVSGGMPSWAWNAELIAGLVVLALAVVLVLVADREAVTDLPEHPSKAQLHRAVDEPLRYRVLAWLGAGLLVLTVVTAMLSGPCGRHCLNTGRHPAQLLPPGLLGTAFVLLGAQFVLVVLLALTVAVMKSQVREAVPDGWRPFLAGFSAPLLCVLGVMLGGALSAAANLSVARVFAQPSGVRLQLAEGSSRLVYLPDQIFGYSTGAVLAVLALAVLAIPLGLRYLRLRAGYCGPRLPPEDPASADRVRNWYSHEIPAAGRVREVAGTWAVAALTDWIAVVLAVLGVAWATGAWAVELTSRLGGRQRFTSAAAVLVTFGVLIGALLAVAGVYLLYSEFHSDTRRKTIGALWDVGTFWPRAAHPLAPPCYAEQAVPEIADRVRLLTGEVLAGSRPTVTPVRADAVFTAPRSAVLTGYSQGAVIVAAVLAQLPEKALERVSLLTLASPHRRLYGRAFPAYFGWTQTQAMTPLLRSGPDAPIRWRNLVRHSDYIGGWLFRPPTLAAKDEYGDIDVPSLDPPSLTPGPGQHLAPTHFHSDFWQDLRTVRLTRELHHLAPPPADPPSTVPPPPQPPSP
jgi:hypothetical protein